MKGLAATALAGPVAESLFGRRALADMNRAERAIFFYFPDGVAGPSQSGEPSLWHCTGSERDFQLSTQLEPLERHKSNCLFFNGLSMGPTDSGSHPGGAKKLLTAVDGGNGESIDQFLARTAGSRSPFRHLYLGAMANQNNASGDKHISYPSPGQTIAPEDDPAVAFDRLFGQGAPMPPGPGRRPPPMMGPPVEIPKTSVIDAELEELAALKARLGDTEKSKLDLHIEALREVELRIQSTADPSMMMGMGGPPPASCSAPAMPPSDLTRARIYDPAYFPAVLRAQIDLMVQAMACGLTRVGTLQSSFHTSELIMSRFPGTEMYDPGFDMRSHQASHYGARHDFGHRELADYVKQRRWFVAQFAYLLDQLQSRPEGGGTMLDRSIVLLVSEVCDGNTHSHDNMPFLLAGRAGGAISTGRLLQYGYERHGKLLVSIARAMGQPIDLFGDSGAGPLPGL